MLYSLTDMHIAAITCFGFNGEGFFRLSVFSHRENVIEAVERIKKILSRDKRRVPIAAPFFV